ncbi:MAG: hypothetical protein MZU97_19735 [Bacillus subtilis]|nr:hypothetical protein [Bacillus subtilis]
MNWPYAAFEIPAEVQAHFARLAKEANAPKPLGRRTINCTPPLIRNSPPNIKLGWPTRPNIWTIVSMISSSTSRTRHVTPAARF